MLAAPPRDHAPTSTRLVGIDVSRALAFGGMLLAHFAGSRRPSDPGWLQAVDNAADGRAAPLFCVLLGLGAGLLAERGTPDRAFVRRGLVLFGLGLAMWPLVDRVYLILPHYGVLLALFPLVRRLPTRGLLPLAGLAFAIPSAVVAAVGDAGLRTAGQPSTYGDLLDAGALVHQLVWLGGYPIVGWAGFVLLGAWVVRHPLGDGGTQWRLLAGGTAIALTQPLVAAVSAALDHPAFLDSTAHSNMAAWYVLASASAVAVIGACLLAARAAAVAVRPLVALGRMALSAYVAHLLLGEAVVFPWLEGFGPALGTQVLVALAVFAAFGAAAKAWLDRHPRGPVETAVRALAG